MFFIASIEKVIRIEPYELGKNLFVRIRQKYSIHLYNQSKLTSIGLTRQTLEPAQEHVATSFRFFRKIY
jgi:hypothetical protein